MLVINKNESFYKQDVVRYMAVKLHKQLEKSKYLLKYQDRPFYVKGDYMKDADGRLWLKFFTYRAAWRFDNDSVYVDNLLDSLAFNMNKEALEKWMSTSPFPIPPAPPMVCVVEDVRVERHVHTGEKHVKIDVPIYCFVEEVK